MLDNALDLGISIFDFWEMTIGELDRVANSKARMDKVRRKENAIHNYIHAVLVGRAVNMSFGGEGVPPIEEVYSDLFKEEVQVTREQIQDKKAELSALRFKQFAKSFNNRFKEAANDKS